MLDNVVLESMTEERKLLDDLKSQNSSVEQIECEARVKTFKNLKQMEWWRGVVNQPSGGKKIILNYENITFKACVEGKKSKKCYNKHWTFWSSESWYENKNLLSIIISLPTFRINKQVHHEVPRPDNEHEKYNINIE